MKVKIIRPLWLILPSTELHLDIKRKKKVIPRIYLLEDISYHHKRERCKIQILDVEGMREYVVRHESVEQLLLLGRMLQGTTKLPWNFSRHPAENFKAALSSIQRQPKVEYLKDERTQELLTSAAYVHLNHLDVSKYTRNLSPASRAILLSGPAELYQQMLAKALAHHFEAKLLLLVVTDFSLKMQCKYGTAKKDPFFQEVHLRGHFGANGSISILPSREDGRGHGFHRSCLDRVHVTCSRKEMVTVSVDGSVLDRIAKIMSYLHLRSFGKVLKKKKKEREVKGRIAIIGNEYVEDERVSKPDGEILQNRTYRENLPPPPKQGHPDLRENQGPEVSRAEDDDIFVGEILLPAL
ncbi:unnamed protein product [Camellia sinensis]